MPFTVLTVCMGNVCRSPMAERLLTLRLADDLEGPPAFAVHSAGVRAVRGATMHPSVRQDLQALGASGEDFAARQITDAMVREADLVLTATTGVRTRVLEDVPTALRRTFTVLDFATLVSSAPPGLTPADLVADASARRASLRVDAHDVPDPINGPPELFAAVTEQLDAATRTIAEALRPR